VTGPPAPLRREGESARPGKLEVVASLRWFGSGHETPGSDFYVGLPRATALDTARSAGIEAIRVFEIEGGTCSSTSDLRWDRLDLLVEGDVVVAGGFF